VKAQPLAFRIRAAKKQFGPTKALDIELAPDEVIEIQRGVTVAILGLSGSGKSTFLNVMALLEDHGPGTEIEYYEVDFVPESRKYNELSNSEKAKLRARDFGVAFQDGHLIGHVSMSGNIELPLRLVGATAIESKDVAGSLINSLQLLKRQSARPKELSGGEYQRVAVARALAHNPCVVFADEPTGNLDSDTGRSVMEMLRSWRESGPDRNVLWLVTHDIRLACTYADLFIVLENGRVKSTLTKAELMQASMTPWRTKFNIATEEVGPEALLKLLEAKTTAKTIASVLTFPKWKSTTSSVRQVAYLLHYSFRDLFPIALRPFNWSVFGTTLRDTVFSVLSVASVSLLVGVLLLGFGVFDGVSEYQCSIQQRDIRANRLIISIDPQSKVQEITDDLVAEIEKDLKKLEYKTGSLFKFNGRSCESNSVGPAVQGVYGFANAELFVYRSENSSETVGAIGSTVNSNDPLLRRLTYKGKPLLRPPIQDEETEGLIVQASWLKRSLGIVTDDFPKFVVIDYGGKSGGGSKERIDLLAVVDDLPDGSFLISRGIWHKIRDGSWRPNYRAIRIRIPERSMPDEAIKKIRDGLKGRHNMAEADVVSDGSETNLLIRSGMISGWTSHYWRTVVFENTIEPVLKDYGFSSTYSMANPALDTPSLPSKLTFINAAVYLNNLEIVGDVARTIRDGKAHLAVDRYVENAYKWIYQTRQLFALILLVVGLCALLFCIVNIFLMFYQTVLRKRNEIGILKAFGCSRRRVATIFVFESLYVSFLGAGIGLGLAMFFGRFLAGWLKGIYQIENYSEPLFLLRAPVATITIACVSIVSLIVTFFATGSAAKRSASTLLRQRA
jgi:putative ABC transport system ATP-binding protein